MNLLLNNNMQTEAADNQGSAGRRTECQGAGMNKTKCKQLSKGHKSQSRHVQWEHLMLGNAVTLPLKCCLRMNHHSQHFYRKSHTQPFILPLYQNLKVLDLVRQSLLILKLKYYFVVLQLLYLS